MRIQNVIESKLKQDLQPVYLEVINESGNHNVPPGSESHFKVVIVSDAFMDKMPVARHRMINRILAEELQNSIHALALHTYTPTEWDEVSSHVPASPPCQGGGNK